MPTDPSIERIINKVRDLRGSAAATFSPEEMSDMELLTALRDGTIRLDDLDDKTLDRMKSRHGLHAMSAIVAAAPSNAWGTASADARTQSQQGHSSLKALRWPLALAAALVLSVSAYMVMSPWHNAAQPGDQPITFKWPEANSPFIPDSRLAMGWQRGGLERDLPDWNKPPIQTMGPGSELLEQMQLSTVIVSFEGGFGSGAIISDDGWILTNYHVVEDAVQAGATSGKPVKARIFFPRAKSGRIERVPEPVAATVYRVDPQHDLALLKLDDIPAAIKPLHWFKIADKVEAGEACRVVGSQAKGPAWSIRSGNITSIFMYPEGFSEEVIGQSSIAAAVERMRAEVLCTDISISGGDSGGPLLNAKGELIGLTFATPVNYSRGSLGFHVSLKHVREFTARMPSTPEAIVPDVWQAGLPDSVRQGPTTVDPDSNGKVDALRFNYSMPRRGPQGGEPTLQPAAVGLFVDLDERVSPGDLESGDVLGTIPRGLWGMGDRGSFRWNVALIIREDGVVLVGYADKQGVLGEVRQGSKGNDSTERAWVRAADGTWSQSADLNGKPLVDPAKVDKKHRTSLAKLRDEVFGGRTAPEPDKPVRPSKPGKPGTPIKPLPGRDENPGSGPNKMKSPG